MNLQCPYCGYIWEPRRPNPASCPRCKRYEKGDKMFGEVESPTELVTVKPSERPPTGGPHAYYLCYACPDEDKQPAVAYINGHNYCLEHAKQIMEELARGQS